jgi:hypothetical protein
MTAFCDLPDPVRMAYRDAIDDAGGNIETYCGPAVLVAMPRKAGFVADLRDAGLELVKGSLWLFPIGTDNPPDSFRHDGKYPDSRGFWLYGKFLPAEEAAPCSPR